MNTKRQIAVLVLPAFFLKAGICAVLFMLAAPSNAEPPCHKGNAQKEQCIDSCKTVSLEPVGDRFVVPASPAVLVYVFPHVVAARASDMKVLPSPLPRTRLLSFQTLLI